MCCCLCLGAAAAAGGGLAVSEAKSAANSVQKSAANAKQNASNLVDKLKGKQQEPVHDVLVRFGLPPGLLPQNVLRYTFDEAKGELTVKLGDPCEVKFGSGAINRYDGEVKGILKRGVFHVTRGIKTKFVVWTTVKSISVDSAHKDQVVFDVGVKKSRPRTDFISPRIAINVFTF